MPFSLALAILVFCIMYLAIQKEKQNEQKKKTYTIKVWRPRLYVFNNSA